MAKFGSVFDEEADPAPGTTSFGCCCTPQHGLEVIGLGNLDFMTVLISLRFK